MGSLELVDVRESGDPVLGPHDLLLILDIELRDLYGFGGVNLFLCAELRRRQLIDIKAA